MNLTIPELSLIVLIGASGSGKSTFARAHFLPNVQLEGRKPLVALARQYHVLPVAVVLNLPEKVCQARNENRPDRAFGPHVVRNQTRNLRQSLRGLQREGFRHVFVLSSEEEIADATITRQPLWNNRKDDHGPFDTIGDVHGCNDELRALLETLGYGVAAGAGSDDDVTVVPPD